MRQVLEKGKATPFTTPTQHSTGSPTKHRKKRKITERHTD